MNRTNNKLRWLLLICVTALIAVGAPEPSAADIAPSAADIAPSAADIAPSAADIAPSAADIAPSAADIAPSAADIAPSAADIAPVAAIVDVDSAERSYDLNDSMLVLEDKEGKLTYKDIKSGKYDHLFARPRHKYLQGMGLDVGRYWIKVGVDFSKFPNQGWKITLRHNAVINRWVIYDDENVTALGTGHALNAEAKSDLEYFYALDHTRPRTNLVMLVDRPLLATHLALAPGAISNTRSAWVSRTTFFIVGALVLMLGFNLLIFISTSEKSYMIYSLTIAAMALEVICMQGVAPRSLNIPPLWNQKLMMLSIWIFWFFALSFLAVHLETKKYFPRWNRALTSLRGLFLLLSMAALVLDPSVTYVILRDVDVFVTPASLSFMVGFPIALWKRSIHARFYLAATLAFVIGVSFGLLGMMGVIPRFKISYLALPIGSLAELAIYGISLKVRMRNHLTHQISEGVGRLKKKTQDIQYILSNMDHGIFKLGEGLTIHPEYSQALEKILGRTNIAGEDAMDLIFSGAGLPAQQLKRIRGILEWSIGDSSISFEVNRDHLPSEVVKNSGGDSEQVLEVHWSAVVDDRDAITSILVTMKDITESRRLAKESEENKASLKVIERIVASGRSQFLTFCTRTIELVDVNLQLLARCPSGSALKAGFKRDLHTIKGNSSMLGFSEIVDIAHQVEECSSSTDLGHRKMMMNGLQGIRQIIENYLKIDAQLIEKIGEQKTAGRSSEKKTIKSAEPSPPPEPNSRNRFDNELKNQFVENRSETLHDLVWPMIASGDKIAISLGKAGLVGQVINDENILIRHSCVPTLYDALVHCIRNTAAHGIEYPEDRTSRGKNPIGRIAFSISRDAHDRATLTIEDDGQGLNMDKIRSSAETFLDNPLMRNISELSSLEVAQMIFMPGFTTRDISDEISGRGIGMDAVRDSLESQNCKVQVQLLGIEDEKGFVPFRIAISIPERHLAFDHQPSKVLPPQPAAIKSVFVQDFPVGTSFQSS